MTATLAIVWAVVHFFPHGNAKLRIAAAVAALVYMGAQ